VRLANQLVKHQPPSLNQQEAAPHAPFADPPSPEKSARHPRKIRDPDLLKNPRPSHAESVTLSFAFASDGGPGLESHNQDGLAAHILDYKPDTRKETHAHVQLTIYALALARRTGLPLMFFKCGWFDEKDYFDFFPLQGVYRRREQR